MKISKKVVLATAAALGVSLGLVACGEDTPAPSGTASSTSTAPVETVKMCVLVSDATSSEALGFKGYYTQYVQKNFPVEFTYSDELADADAEKRAMEGFISNNCKAVISFASADRPAQLQMAEDAGIHYAVATGTLSADDFATYKGYEHYVGAIGPSLDIELEAGYAMAKHFMDEGDTRFAIFGAGVPYYIDMHVYRTAGMLAALATEASTSYGGVKDSGQILGTILQDGTVHLDKFSSDVYELTGYHAEWNLGDSAWQANLTAVVASEPDVILAAGTGFAIFGAAVAGTDVRIGDIDAYTAENGEAMESGSLAYLAGKFTSSIGPIFAATLSAVQGHPVRDDKGQALALEQGYWVATSAEDFTRYLAADTIEAPVYGKAELSPLIGEGVTYETFSTFLSRYSADDLVG